MFGWEKLEVCFYEILYVLLYKGPQNEKYLKSVHQIHPVMEYKEQTFYNKLQVI